MPSFVSSDGLRIAYRDESAGPDAGPALLCLAGLTRDGRDFDYVAPHLAGWRVIRMDYRGRGGSEWAKNFRSYSVPVEARDALELLDHLGVERTAILGTSRGGLIAMYLAATAPERLRGICLNDIGPELDPAGLDKIMDYVGRDPAFSDQEAYAAALPGLMPGFEGVPASRWRQEAERHSRQTARGLRITYDPRLRDALNAAGEAPAADMWPLFDAMAGLPLALIRGANSDLLSTATAARMRRKRPDMIYAEVPGRGHIPFLDEPEALDALARFRKAVA